MSESINSLINEMRTILVQRMIPFWLDRSVDSQYGGFLTSFDANGCFDGNGVKYLVTQSRMIWGFARLMPFARLEDRERMRQAAAQGVSFLLEHFHDAQHGGFFWKTNRDGSVADPAKLVYGQSFAIYALSEYAHVYHDAKAGQLAMETFDLLQIYAADTCNGGYYENLEHDWSRSPFGVGAGNRKSLDIHMHLMEAFTALSRLSGREIHKRKLLECVDLIRERMMDTEAGYGFNQFDLSWNRMPAINIPRTWNAERESNIVLDKPLDTTSYGHNVELSWLMDEALRSMGVWSEAYAKSIRNLLNHALAHGYDTEYGGVYRDGLAKGEALVQDKEWWQNFEAMVGFLNGYVLFHFEGYYKAFLGTWDFIKQFFLHSTLGESRQLLDRTGRGIVDNLGNPWKGIYHTGRAMAECITRLESIVGISKKEGY